MSDNGSILRGITNKDQKQQVRKLLKQGWEVHTTGSTHLRMEHTETGAWFTMSLTSRSHRAALLVRKSAEKALKQARRERRR